MRGSVIQQIFRVLHESHSPATRKNKEWQEKLPIVVLKAEEIMYSKANSEAEYMDFQTLWERVNDAINTIIRRDESTETGDLLPPCVEAALNLGCVPVRASRSQRHTNPRSYLSPRSDEPGCSSSKILENPTKNQNHQLPPRLVNQSNTLRPVGMNPPCLITESRKHVLPNSTHMNTVLPNVGSVYPLYYGTQFQKQPECSLFPFQIPTNSNPIIMGTPVFPSMSEPPRMGCFHDPALETNARNKNKEAPEPGFDLSLRLGLFKEPSVGPRKGQVNDINREFPFFPVETTNDPSGFGTSRWSFESEGHGTGPAFRKRRAPFDINLEDEPSFSQPQLRSDRFAGQIKRPGL